MTTRAPGTPAGDARPLLGAALMVLAMSVVPLMDGANLRGLLCAIGRVYAPAQLANAQAVQAGEKDWEAEIDGARWTQRSFPYQAKCLKWTNEAYRALTTANRSRVDALLAGTGVEAMLTAD